MFGARATTVHVVQLPKCSDKIKIRVMQRVIRNMVTSSDELYEMEVKVHPRLHTLKRIREKLETAENLRGWPLPINGYTFRHQPLNDDDADNDGVELTEGGGRTFQKLGINDGDAIMVVPVPSNFKVSIAGMGVGAILVEIRSSDKVVTLRQVLQRRHTENLPTHFQFSFGEVLMDDEMPFHLYGLRKGDRIRVSPQSAPQTSALDRTGNSQEAQTNY